LLHIIKDWEEVRKKEENPSLPTSGLTFLTFPTRYYKKNSFVLRLASRYGLQKPYIYTHIYIYIYMIELSQMVENGSKMTEYCSNDVMAKT
jgi:hypothetical protein